MKFDIMKKLSSADFLPIVKSLHPEFLEKQIEIRDEGWDHVAFVLGQETVLRFPRRENYQNWLVTVSWFLEKFGPTSPLRVPRPTIKKFQISDQNRLYEEYEYLPGATLDRGILKNLEPKSFEKLADDLANFLASLHRFPTAEAKQLGLRQDVLTNSAQKFYQRAQINWRRLVQENPGLADGETNRKQQKWLEEIRGRDLELINQPIRLCVIHGDFDSPHILFDPEKKKLTGIIDFSDLIIGDPAQDFQFIKLLSERLYQKVRELYGPPLEENFDARLDLLLEHRKIMSLVHAIERREGKEIKRRFIEFSECLRGSKFENK